MKNTDNKYKNLAKDTLLFVVSNFGSKIFVFFLTPLYTNILLPEEYGVADFITTTINFIYPILTLAIADAVLRFALDKNSSRKSVFSISLILVFVASIIVLICLKSIYHYSDNINNYGIYFVVIFSMFNLHNVFSNFIKGIGKTTLFAIQGIIQTLVIIVCNLYFLLIKHYGIYGYLNSIIMGYFVPIIVIFFYGKLYSYLFPVSLDFILLKKMLRYSIPMIPSILMWSVNVSIDKYMIIGFLGIGASGIYSIAHKVPTLLTNVVSIFNQAWQISAISIHGSEDESEYYTNIYITLEFICILGIIFIIPFSKTIAKILFAKDYYIAWIYVPLLTLSAFFSTMSGFLAAAFRASMKTICLFVSIGIGGLVNILLNLFLIVNLGVIGAAYATAISFFVTWLVRIIQVQKIVQVKINILNEIIICLLLFLSASFISFESPFGIYGFAVSLMFIFLIKRNDLKNIYRIMSGIIGRNRCKK